MFYIKEIGISFVPFMLEIRAHIKRINLKASTRVRTVLMGT